MVHCAVAPIVVVVGLHSCGGWWWWLRSTKGTLRVPLFTLVCSIAAKTTAEEDGGRWLGYYYCAVVAVACSPYYILCVKKPCNDQQQFPLECQSSDTMGV